MQTAGRGRLGRDWVSPAGNLHASTLVRLRAGDPSAATLAMVAAVALDEAVRLLLPDPTALRIKWPNDLLLEGAKLSGILLERAGEAVVVGMGVNLAHHPGELGRPTTDLASHGAGIDPTAFLDILVEAFARWLGRWRGEGLAPVRARWSERAHPRGTALSAGLPDGTRIDGLFERIDADGALVLRLATGDTRVIHAADVFLI